VSQRRSCNGLMYVYCVRACVCVLQGLGEPAVRRLFVTAKRLFEAAPWNVFSATDILRCVVRAPEQPEVTLYCVVMGQTGMAYGVSFYEVGDSVGVAVHCLCVAEQHVRACVWEGGGACSPAPCSMHPVHKHASTAPRVRMRARACLWTIAEPGGHATHPSGQAATHGVVPQVHSVRGVGRWVHANVNEL
jgi:hypothetical protein